MMGSVIHHAPGEYDVHRDAVPWYEAPLPPLFHRCKPWTTMRSQGESYVRCACGADRYRGHWFDKNKRRRERRIT